MHPEFFSIGNLTIHTYGFLIMLGAIAGYFYISISAKRELNISPDKIQSLAIIIILSAVIGGKIFFYFEKPDYYFSSPSNMLKNFRTGFVFYGSLLFVIPAAVWFFKREKWPIWAVLDRLAITGTIIHGFGRLGCFFAGCCYGKPTDSFIGITFTNELSQAKPLNTPIHPTQLYEFTLLFSIFIFLLMLKRTGRMKGQLIFVYIILYAIGRSINEIFRGDLSRGFIIEDVLSHSQFISIVLLVVSVWLYFRFRNRSIFTKES